MKVVITASKLAGATGLHPFKAREDVVQEFARKYAPWRADPKHVSGEQAGRDALAALPRPKRDEVLSAIAAAAKVSSTSAADVMAHVPTDVPPEVAELARSAMSTAYGTRLEDRARCAYGAAKNVAVAKDDAYRERALMSVPVVGRDAPVEVYLGGKHDGVTTVDDREVLVEVKNRMKRFLGAPQYEVVQVMAYMHIFGIRDAVLVESYGGEEREHVVPFDEALWEDVKARVSAFVAQVV